MKKALRNVLREGPSSNAATVARRCRRAGRVPDFSTRAAPAPAPAATTTTTKQADGGAPTNCVVESSNTTYPLTRNAENLCSLKQHLHQRQRSLLFEEIRSRHSWWPGPEAATTAMGAAARSAASQGGAPLAIASLGWNEGSSLFSAIACAAAAAAAAAVAAGVGGNEGTKCEYADKKFHQVYDMSDDAPTLGSGSFGTVTVAVHKTTAEVVAVKRIPRSPELTFAEISWETEVLKLAGEHKNITQFYDVFEDEDCFFLTMEYARGGELFDLLLDMGPPDEVNTAQLMKALVGAVTFVHMHGIIHGDIKPENVFLTSPRAGDVDWEGVRLGDFGSAVEVALGGKTEFHGLLTRGTVAYNPPESLRRMLDGKDVVVTPGGDVWALGVVLFMLLTGEHPFAPDMSVSDDEMAECVLQAEDGTEGRSMLFVDQYTPGGDGPRSSVSPLARDLIMKMLRKDPDKRVTAQEVLLHPWFMATIPGLQDGGMNLLSKEGQKYGRGLLRPTHRRVRFEGAAPSSSEAMQKFWSARRRLKACLLAIMSGLVDGVFPDSVGDDDDDYDEKDADSGEGNLAGEKVNDGLGDDAQATAARRKMSTTMKKKDKRQQQEQQLREEGGLGWRFRQEGESEDEGDGWDGLNSSSGVGVGVGGSGRRGGGSRIGIDGRQGEDGYSEEQRRESSRRAREIEAVERDFTPIRPHTSHSPPPLESEADRVAEAIAATVARPSMDENMQEEGDKERAAMEQRKATVAAVAAAAVTADNISSLTRRKKRSPPYPIGSREAACGMIDQGNKGYINFNDLAHVTKLMGEQIGRGDIHEMMKAIDGDPSTEPLRFPYEQMVRAIPPLCPPRPIGVGEKLYREGEMDPTFYLLTKGVVEFSVSALQGKAPLQRQGPGASFGEVELLRADGSTAPRLATCKCLGNPTGGDEGCEVLVVSGGMFELLTDVYSGVRAKLGRQTEARLTQLAGSVLRNAFEGEESSMRGLDVIWGQKESMCVWNCVRPARIMRNRRPNFWRHGSLTSPPPVELPAPSFLSPSSPIGDGKREGDDARSSIDARDFHRGGYPSPAAPAAGGTPSEHPSDNSSSHDSTVPGQDAEKSGDSRSAAAAAAAHVKGGDGGAGSEGSFVVLILEGSVTAVYDNHPPDDEVHDDDAAAHGRVDIPTREQVLEAGQFCFCGDGFGPGAPESPTLVTCKLWQHARVLRVPAADFKALMSKKTMEALTEFMFDQ